MKKSVLFGDELMTTTILRIPDIILFIGIGRSTNQKYIWKTCSFSNYNVYVYLGYCKTENCLVPLFEGKTTYLNNKYIFNQSTQCNLFGAAKAIFYIYDRSIRKTDQQFRDYTTVDSKHCQLEVQLLLSLPSADRFKLQKLISLLAVGKIRSTTSFYRR